MLDQYWCISFTQRDFGYSPNPCTRITLDASALPRCVLGAAGHRFGQARIVAAEEAAAKDSLSDIKL